MKWIKENGIEIETNDRPETIAKCEELGWKKKERKKRTPKMEIIDKEDE